MFKYSSAKSSLQIGNSETIVPSRIHQDVYFGLWSFVIRSGIGENLNLNYQVCIGVKLIRSIRNTTLRSQPIDVDRKAAKLKRDLARQVCRMPSEIWAKITTNWKPRDSKRRSVRPRQRWQDDLLGLPFKGLVRCSPELGAVEREVEASTQQ